MLAWVMGVLIGTVAIGDRRRRQRYQAISLQALAQRTAALILIRAAELTGKRRYEHARFHHGRDVRRPAKRRAFTGVRLRRALRHRDPLTRVAILIDALRRIDTHARILLRRLRRGLTRACRRMPKPQSAEALVALCLPTPSHADTS